ncbi:leucine-rich_repeat domain-containing protein [Hexamita inflata]|uniref:Leucine-rich repeat domain-containing protein n=1 Tax=Hexamita inflata TaxID=28002 RepID=A0AA86U1M6_9EUKA|nr:leucine-rich repeat domain-containing protein [Hexamita inflata]
MNEEEFQNMIQLHQNQDQNVQNKILFIQNKESIKDIFFVDELEIENLFIQDCPNVQFTKTPLKVTKLQVNYCDLKQLSGIEQMLQLTELNLSTNSLENVDPLSTLVNLVFLDLTYNKITDISPLHKLVKLQTLLSYRNSIQSLYPLRNSQNLEFLNLGSNNITDLHPLRGLKNLKSLEIWNNKIQNVNHKFIQKLKFFEASQNKIMTFESFEGANFENQTIPSIFEVTFQAKLNVIYSMIEQVSKIQKQMEKIKVKMKMTIQNSVKMMNLINDQHLMFAKYVAQILEMEQMAQQ